MTLSRFGPDLRVRQDTGGRFRLCVGKPGRPSPPRQDVGLLILYPVKEVGSGRGCVCVKSGCTVSVWGAIREILCAEKPE